MRREIILAGEFGWSEGGENVPRNLFDMHRPVVLFVSPLMPSCESFLFFVVALSWRLGHIPVNFPCRGAVLVYFPLNAKDKKRKHKKMKYQ